MSRKSYDPRLMLAASMVLFGTIGIFRRCITLPSSLLALCRGGIGAVCLLLFGLLKGRSINWAAVRDNLFLLLLSGALIGFNWILLFEAYQYTSVAVATLCYYMAPVFVIMTSPLLLKEALGPRQLLCVALSLLGMVLVSGVLNSDFSGLDQLKGVLLGLAAALLYAGVIVCNKLFTPLPDLDKTLIQLSAAALVLLPYTLLTADEAAVNWTGLTLLMTIIVGVVHTGCGYVMYFGALGRLPAQTAALFSYIDPVVAILLSALLLKEGLSLAAVIGSVLVLGSTFINEQPAGSSRSGPQSGA